MKSKAAFAFLSEYTCKAAQTFFTVTEARRVTGAFCGPATEPHNG